MRESAVYPRRRPLHAAFGPRADPAVVDAVVAANSQKRAWAQQVALICVAGAVFGLFTANPLLTAAGLLILPILFVLLWYPGEPPALLFAAAFQWSQVFIPVLRADFRGEPLGVENALPRMDTAAWLSLGAILALAVGMRLGRGGGLIAAPAKLAAFADELAVSRLVVAYAGALAFSLFGTGVAEDYAGLQQGLLALGLTRWMLAFLLLWCAMGQARFRRAAMFVLVIELTLGLGGYFSSFKTILFLATIVALGNETKLVSVLRPRTAVMMAAALVLTTLWQAVKMDYRAFLNQGTGAQVELVSPLERVDFLLRKTGEIDLEDVYSGLDSGLQRLGYLDFFATTLEQVPESIPYQRGRLWGEAISHVLMPRLFFPSKAPIHDSERTNEFSGLRVAGAEQGTTISLGYVTESYIDFGPALMFLPVLLLGGFWGWVFRWLSFRAGNELLGLSAATTVVLMGAILFETSNIKVLGGALSNVVVLGVALTLWSKPLWKMLSEPKFTRPRR